MKRDRKISETLLEFASPVLSLFGGEVSPERIRPAFVVAVTAWNAVILDESEESTEFIMKARNALGGGPELGLFDILVERKRTEFASDRRLIGNFEVYKKRGEFRLRAFAHEPPARR